MPPITIKKIAGLPPRNTPAPVAKQVTSNLRQIARLSVAPIWHAVLIDSLAGQSDLEFFTNVPQGALSWFLGNFRRNYIGEQMTIYGMRLYFVGDGAAGGATNANTGAMFRVSGQAALEPAEFVAADLIPGIHNLINDSLSVIKVNQSEHPFLATSKFLSPIKWAEYGYALAGGNTAFSSLLILDPSVPYYVFRTPKHEIDPFEIGDRDLFSTRLRFPAAFPVVGQIPDHWYLKYELLCKVTTSMYAG
jgi:hypothetical protein